MPQYLYQHPESEDVIEVFQHMNDVHEYVDETGVKWNRLFTKPNASIDTEVDPYSSKDFVKITNKPGTMGDLWDRSAELSNKRSEKEGKDPVKEKFYDSYSKKHNGSKHYLQQREENSKQLKSKGIVVEYND
jgi:hypothetical protein